MLSEIRGVRQIPGEGRRRWFRDEKLDLIVWYDDGDVTGFQLCYDTDADERAITWYATGSFVHARVDSGDHPGQINATPILVSDGVFDATSIAERFRAAAAEIDPEIAQMVYRKLLEYPG